MLKYFGVILIPLLMASCAGSDKENSEIVQADSIKGQYAEKYVAPVFPSVVDSFEIVYYKKPFKDSTRYSRFFRVTFSKDSTVIGEIRKILLGDNVKLREVKKCLSEGKLIIPQGRDALRTIYFSRVETDCPYIYYIKDGAFYYYEMSPVLSEKLNLMEKLAVEP